MRTAGAKQSYAEQESLVNQQLAQLIRDAVWLKSYLAAVMRLSQEAFQLSHVALGPPQGPAQVLCCCLLLLQLLSAQPVYLSVPCLLALNIIALTSSKNMKPECCVPACA